MSAAATTASARRSLPVTLLGWLLIASGAALSVISFFSLLMILAGSEGARNASLGGFLLVVAAPPCGFAAGIGLVRRWRWSWFFLVGGLALALGWQISEAARPPRPAVSTTILPSGTKHTVFDSGPRFSAPLAAVLAGLLAYALMPGVRREFFPGRKGPPPLPGSEPRNPGQADLPDAAGQSSPPLTQDQGRRPARGWLGGALLLLGLAAFMSWTLKKGLEEGEIPLPAAKGGLRHSVSRESSPILFWTCAGVHGLVGAASLGMAALAAAAGLRYPRSEDKD